MTYISHRRVILSDLRTSSPDRLDQIYVFSSFFYKKLSLKKYVIALVLLGYPHPRLDSQRLTAAFASGRRLLIFFRRNTSSCPSMKSTFSLHLWTAMIHCDSLHWYLLIIYKPNHLVKDLLHDDPNEQQRVSIHFKSLTNVIPDSCYRKLIYSLLTL